MKKLQRNYTTIEQSKRLLELGVPADSADCYYKMNLYSFKTEMCFTKEDSLLYHYTPCWSVGRLIEIYLICNEVVCGVTELHHSAVKIDVREFSLVDYIIRKIENKIKKKGENFLSKLEE